MQRKHSQVLLVFVVPLVETKTLPSLKKVPDNVKKKKLKALCRSFDVVAHSVDCDFLWIFRKTFGFVCGANCAAVHVEQGANIPNNFIILRFLCRRKRFRCLDKISAIPLIFAWKQCFLHRWKRRWWCRHDQQGETNWKQLIFFEFFVGFRFYLPITNKHLETRAIQPIEMIEMKAKG